jgi:type IV secretory pathway VirJ component
MPKGKISKGEIKAYIEQLKTQLYHEGGHHGDDHTIKLAHKYLNKILDKVQEYRE